MASVGELRADSDVDQEVLTSRHAEGPNVEVPRGGGDELWNQGLRPDHSTGVFQYLAQLPDHRIVESDLEAPRGTAHRVVLETLWPLPTTEASALGHIVALIRGTMDAKPPSERLDPDAIREERSTMAWGFDQGPATGGSLRRHESGTRPRVSLPPQLFQRDSRARSNEVAEEVTSWRCWRPDSWPLHCIQLPSWDQLRPAPLARHASHAAVGGLHEGRDGLAVRAMLVCAPSLWRSVRPALLAPECEATSEPARLPWRGQRVGPDRALRGRPSHEGGMPAPEPSQAAWSPLPPPKPARPPH